MCTGPVHPPVAKWYCLDMTHSSYGTFTLCQTDGSNMEHMRPRISQQLQILVKLKSPSACDPGTTGAHVLKPETLNSLILTIFHLDDN